MAHEIIATIRVGFADDPQQMAEALGEVAEAWAQMLAAIDQRQPEVTFSVNETRARGTNGTGAKRGRKPRQPATLTTEREQTEAPQP